IETRIDISKALDKGFGNAVVVVEPAGRVKKEDRTRVAAWIQSTHIGLDAFVDSEELVAYVSDLKTGEALGGAELSLYPTPATSTTTVSENAEPEKGYIAQLWDWIAGTGNAGGPSVRAFDESGAAIETESIEPSQTTVTGANGILRLALPPDSAKDPNILIARRGGDVAFLPRNSDYYWNDDGWFRTEPRDSLRWFVFNDRGMYKPNEEVSVKGYIRVMTAGKLADIAAVNDKAHGLKWVAKDPRGNEIAKGEGNLNAFGAFDLKFKLPDNANLGYASVEISTESDLGGDSTTHQFRIQEFRRPEFEVKASVQTEGPHFIGDSVQILGSAKYYAGGGLADADVEWTVQASPAYYSPPNHEDFTFGTWIPWWRSYSYGRYGGGETQTFESKTDASGEHLLKIDFDSVKPPRPYTIRASAAVQDVNRQTWSGSTTMMVHPADLYVGIKTPRTFVQKGEQIKVQSIVTDLDGKVVTGRDIEITATLKDNVFAEGAWSEKVIDE